MEIYDNNEEGDVESDDGIEVEDDDDDEKEESLSPVDGAGSSTGRTLYRMMSLYSVLPSRNVSNLNICFTCDIAPCLYHVEIFSSCVNIVFIILSFLSSPQR